MERETFGVELELITSKFSQKMEQMKSRILNFSKTAKQNFQTGLYMNVDQSKKDLVELQKELDILKKSNFEWTPIGSADNLVNTKDRIREITLEIDSLKKDINTIETSKISKIGQVFKAIKTPIDKLKNSINQSKKGMNEFSTAVNKSFNKGIASVKRFGLSLFGIQSIWRVVSRASSSYLSQDIELSNKLQAVWVGLGSTLAPILNSLANFFIKMVSYLNIFIKSLTNGKVDLLGNAMAKANENTKKTASSVKTLKGQLGGFDEINNIANTSDSGSSSTADTSWTSAFENVPLDTSWTQVITDFGNWIKDNWQLVVVGILGITSAIKALSFASTLAGLGLKGMLKPLMAIILGATGIAFVVLGIIELFKEGGNQTKAWTLILGGLALVVLAVWVAFGGGKAMIALVVAAVVAGFLWIIKNWDAIIGAIGKGAKAIGNFFVGLWNGIVNVFKGVGKWFGDIFAGAWNGIKKAFSSVSSFFKGIWTTIKNMFTKIGSTIGNAIGGAFKVVVNSIISFAENTINGFIKAINFAISAINLIPGVKITKLNLLNIPKLDTGTNYVPNDQLAYIHKGEAVVPKKFNSEQYFGSGNEETNELLRELIQTIDDKDTNTYLDGKAIGKVARKYIVNQNRIMGRSVI